MAKRKEYVCGHCTKVYSHNGFLARNSKGEYSSTKNPFGCSKECAIEIYNASWRNAILKAFEQA